MLVEGFEDISTQDQGLLIGILLFGGQEGKSLLAYCQKERQASLLPLFERLKGVERTKRVVWLIAKLKVLIELDTQNPLLLVHPSWLLYLVKKEPESLLEIILQAIPESVSSILKNHFEIQEKKHSKILSRELLICIKKNLVKQLWPIAFQSLGKELQMRHLVLLPEAHWKSLLIQLGRQWTGRFFLSLGIAKTAEAMRALPEDLKTQLVDSIQQVQVKTGFDETWALGWFLKFLKHQTVEDFLIEVGVFALSHAMHLESESLFFSVAQRLNVVYGKLLEEYHKDLNSEKQKRYTDLAKKDLFDTWVYLAEEGILEKRFSECVVKSSVLGEKLHA